jgi:hypothetical protein
MNWLLSVWIWVYNNIKEVSNKGVDLGASPWPIFQLYFMSIIKDRQKHQFKIKLKIRS